MPIVYEGVGGERGNLFQGLKLWISYRVPQRSRWIDLVKGNGGEIVQLEKTADMLIADNVKRGGAPPPPGAYTWKWIEFSVRNHTLQPKEDYLITTAAPRAIGSSAPTKAIRTPFTNHDDLVLTKFVLAKEALGEGTMGNEIYREFERKHPNHPWQSWRDRWVKNLANRRRSDLPVEDSHPGPAAEPLEPGEPVQPAQPAQPAIASASKPKHQRTQSSGASPSASALERRPKGRNFFTPAEDKLLLDYIRKAQEYNKTARGKVKSLSGNKIYQEFAEIHPSHTWHSWRDRWVRHLCLSDDIEEDEAGPQQEGEDSDPFEEEPQPQLRLSRHTAESRSLASTEVKAAPPTSERSSNSKQVKAKSDDARLERQEQAKRKARAAKLLQRHWRGTSVRRDCARFETVVVPLQSLVRGYLVRVREAERLLQASEAQDELHEDDPDEEDVEQYEDAEEISANGDPEGETEDPSARDQFYTDLQDYIDVSGAGIDLEPVVEGHKVDLWGLFKAATKQPCNPEERNWKEVAEELGFDWLKSARCLPKLWECYIQNLAEFEEAVKSYDNPDDEDEDESVNEDEEGDGEEQQQQMETGHTDRKSQTQTSDAVTASKGPPAAPSSHAYRSSPPIAGVKRSFQHAEFASSELSYPPDSSRKRQKLHQKAEIPPTPEDRLGLRRDLAGRRWAHDNSSPLKPGSAAAQLLDIDSEEEAEELLGGDMGEVEEADELPELPRPPKKFVEPETQDFGFDVGGDNGYATDEDDVSPSQQLQTESDMINSPVLPSTSRQNAATTTNSRPFGASRPKPAEVQTTRPASSNPRTTMITATGVSTRPGGSVNGMATKRSLPRAYLKPSSSAPGGASGFTPTQNGTAQQRPRPNPSVAGRAFAVPPPRAVPGAIQGATSRASPGMRSTPTPAMRSSPTPLRPSSRRTLTSAASPLRQYQRNGSRSNVDGDPAVVDAQFAHFEALGYEKAHIGRALVAATFERGPMTVALQSLHEGRGLPQREPGVWTDDDDNELQAIREYDRRRARGKYAAGSEGEEERHRARVESYRARLRAKHGRWVEFRMGFMDTIDEAPKV